MPSPFPGMDPWLERPELFPSFHNGLVIYLQAALNAVLPAGYVATNDNRVYVDPELQRVPDIGVLGPNSLPIGAAAVAIAAMAGAGLLAAATEAVSDPVEEPYLEIRSLDDDRLVTAIEVVSPANKKAGADGRISYQQKQGEYRASGVNLVEIDLLRAGPHTTAVPAARLRAVGGECDYHVCVMIAGSPHQYFVAPIRLADPLPLVPIPLDEGVAPVLITLQAVFDRCYDEGGFAHLAKYNRRHPQPPLTTEQQAWAEGILRAKGRLP
jgi:hypothetical protein